MHRLSIVIPNFNYAQFVGFAIESALALNWPDLEVIVVDDGSTDNSVEVIRQYLPAVTFISQPNSGPRVACNAGFARSTGDWILFLDSDDTLSPELPQALRAHATSGVSKVQVQMQKIDRVGHPVGKPFPKFRPVPNGEQIRAWMRETSSYPTPPGSGNMYSRKFLESLFPLGDECGDATDSICLAAAPFLGEVVTVAQPLVQYRIHGNNRSYLLADSKRFTLQLQRAMQRQRFAHGVRGYLDDSKSLTPLFRSRHVLQLRAAELRLHGEPTPLPGDGLGRMRKDAFAVLSAPGPEPLLTRFAISAWVLLLLAVPAKLVPRVLRWRYQQ